MMSPDRLFDIANLAALIGWLFLAALPRWQGTQAIAMTLIPLLLGAAYAVLLFSNFEPSTLESFGTLDGLAGLFRSKEVILVGWLHYLAFDLFVGGWEVRDAQARGIPHWLVLPCLFFTFMAGPFGLLLYFLIRTVKRRGLPPLA